MKKIISMLIWLVSAFLIFSCASKQLAPPEMEFEEKSIKIHMKADPQLNLSDGTSHTLLVCVYQLKEPNTFNQLADDQEGLYRLLECKLFDPSVAGTKRLVVQPGTDTEFSLDRAQGARYVAVVAGYYLLDKERMVRLYEIPVVIEKKGLIRRTKKKKLDALNVDLKLGPKQIE